ncbi:MAG: PA domain-containing protein, partial [Acidimicrobiia bacterium]
SGCSPLIGLTPGTIAVINRGDCPMLDKVLNAQAAGAVAVIVTNDVPGDPTTIDGSSQSVTIPAVMVSQDDGALFSVGLPATATVRAKS